MVLAQPGRMVTPEAVPLDFELAGVGSRLFALLLDWAIQAATLFAVLFGAAVVVGATGGADRGVSAAAVYTLVFLAVFGYPIALETLWRGRTVGKAAFGLRVVTKEGAPVRFRHAAIRAALGLVDFFLTGGAAAFLSALVSRDNQRLGDIVAGTIVLRERTGMRAAGAVTFPVPYGLEGYVATLDVSGLTPDDYGAVRAFLLRAPTLPAPVRNDLALGVATPIARRLRTTPPDGIPPETFLLCVAAAQQRRGLAPAAPTGPAAPTVIAPVPAPVPTAAAPTAAAPPDDTGAAGFAPPA